jgi:hypothetical protein
MLRRLRKTAGSPESGLPASNLNAADGYENQLSATAEMINTSSARGTVTRPVCVKIETVNISTEIRVLCAATRFFSKEWLRLSCYR